MATYKVNYDIDGKRTHLVDGKIVTQEEFDALLPSKPIEVPLHAHTPGCWPILSEAMGVAPNQVAEAVEYAKANGVPTDYTADGRAILRDRAHRKRFLRMSGYHDRSGGYSD